jgi:long-chain acyl-CoA synthetase
MQAASYSDLVDVLGQSLVAHGPRRLFGTKKGGEWVWVTYAEFGRRVADFRGGLHALGIRQGDTVAVISANRVEWAVAAYAAYGLGARFCPMYESQLPEEWEYIVADSGAKLLIASTHKIYEKVVGFAGQIPGLEQVFSMSLPEEDAHSFLAIEKLGREKPVPNVKIDPEWVCGFIYTSGTTGKAKGVLLTHNNIVSNINAVMSLFPMDHSDVTVSFLPWAHSFGQTCELHCLISRGAAMAIAESVEKLVDNLGEIKPTMLLAVPRIFNRIYDGLQKRMAVEGGLKKVLFDAGMANAEKRKQLRRAGRSSALVELKHSFFDKVVFSKVRARFGGRMKYAISGGAALSPEVADFIDKLGIVVCEGYGLTETSPISTANFPDARKIGSVGRAIPGVQVIIDTSVVDNKESGDGEIVIKGPNVMKGYHNRPEETAEVMTADGAFRTGDLGRLDADGFLYITGRIKEQYKLENGKYVVPAPLEEELQTSLFIVHAFLDGANKLHNVLLLVPDRLALLDWAKANGLQTSDYAALLEDAKVRKLFEAEIDSHSKLFKSYEKPRRFKLIPEEFTVDNGMLTPKMSVKRKVVYDRYAQDIAELHR